jgi:hypothetical protein
MLDSLIPYFFVVWTSLLSLVVRAKQRVVAVALRLLVVQAPKPNHHK